MTEIAQKACLLEGVTQLLSVSPGDFAVVLHSDPDCANLVIRDSRAVDPRRFFCTNIEERDVLAGTSRARLERAIDEVVAARRPRVVFVVGSCVSSMLADDIDAACGARSRAAGTAVVPIEAQAFRLHGQAEILDLVTGLLAELAAGGAERIERSVNLVGYPGDMDEVEGVLAVAGIEVVGRPFPGSPAREWERLPEAGLSVVSDPRPFGRLLDMLERRHGQPHVIVPPPFGLEASRVFHLEVAGRMGRRAEAEAAIRGPEREAAGALERAREALGGRRLAYHVGGRKDFQLWTVVDEGLFLVGMFREMGLEVTLLFQGAVEESAGERIAGALSHRGLDAPFVQLRDRVSVTAALRDGGFQAICCSPSLREEVGAAGVPLVPATSMRPGLAGLVLNVEHMLALPWEEGRP